MKNIIYIVALLIIISCSKEKFNLPGKWYAEQISPEESHRYTIYFCDNNTFKLKVASFFDAVDQKNCLIPAFNEYVSGTYELSEERIKLSGHYTDSTFTNKKTSGCHTSGVYIRDRSFTFVDGSFNIEVKTENFYNPPYNNWLERDGLKFKKIGDYKCDE